MLSRRSKQNVSVGFGFLVTTLLVFGFVTQSFGARKERLIDTWKPTNYNVSITFDDKLSGITSARAEITIVALKDRVTQIDLDFGELPIDAVTIDRQSTQYTRTRGTLNVKLLQPVRRGDVFVVAISYHGKPQDGLVLTEDKAGKPTVIGDNWPDRLHHWIPCFDHPSAKATITFSITAPANNLVVANGKLSRIETSANTTRTWTYVESVPIPPYCMVLAVGDFALVDPPDESTPLAYYTPQPDQAFAMQGFAPANPSLKFFSQTVAPYPYEKLALIIGATRFGGMENSSAIVFASTLFDARPKESLSDAFKIREGLRNVVAHEIAHQWFGDSVTESTWADLWLSEGFADYFAALFIQRYDGEPAFQRYMKQLADTYFHYETTIRTPIHDTETEDLFKLLNANNYQKGAWVLHMLRSELGDAQFFRGIRIYYEAHENATASTEDLRTAFEKASGRDLKEFFARWIYGAGHPSYELSWTWNQKTNKAKLLLKQVQVEPAFPNSVAIEIQTATGTRRFVLKPNGKQTVEEVKLSAAPTTMNIDPDNTLLKDARVNQ
ncbi:MAG TPA: M1 family metallopeptidase [Pyrinomonadaceae bacterium]|jgi:aminopeptidase N|nr:M1 family metallopeptidase [Pyrinomonadaceae bacterium]